MGGGDCLEEERRDEERRREGEKGKTDLSASAAAASDAAAASVSAAGTVYRPEAVLRDGMMLVGCCHGGSGALAGVRVCVRACVPVSVRVSREVCIRRTHKPRPMAFSSKHSSSSSSIACRVRSMQRAAAYVSLPNTLAACPHARLPACPPRLPCHRASLHAHPHACDASG